MSQKSIAREILDLVELANAWLPESDRIHVDEVQHFIAGITNPGIIKFQIETDFCAVVLAIETFNSDAAAAETISKGEGGKAVTQVQPAQWTTGADLFYVYPSGLAEITVAATPEAGKTFYARAVGFFLPFRAQRSLSRMATKIIG